MNSSRYCLKCTFSDNRIQFSGRMGQVYKWRLCLSVILCARHHFKISSLGPTSHNHVRLLARFEKTFFNINTPPPTHTHTLKWENHLNNHFRPLESVFRPFAMTTYKKAIFSNTTNGRFLKFSVLKRGFFCLGKLSFKKKR